MPKEIKTELENALGQARGVLEDLHRLGVGEVYRQPVDKDAAVCDQLAPQQGSVETLDQIRTDLGDCQRCSLSESRSRVVYGVGNPNADLVFVGEGPGREEDRSGEPFAGEAGQLLDRIINAMGMQRGDVYCCNVVKCRPPDNRDPLPDEISTCEPFLARQLDSIQPKIIIALGMFAAQTLLKTNTPISKLRGQWHIYRSVPLMPTFHPAYLLRKPLGKREVWDDMKSVLRKLRELHGSDC